MFARHPRLEKLRLPCRFRGSPTWPDTENTPYPGYVSTCERTKRMKLDTALSNGLVESMTTKIRLITRIAFGKDPTALIALAMLSFGGHRPHLPGRHTA